MLLDPGEAAPAPLRRVLVAGASGAGKTTLAKRLSGVLDIPHVELDGLFHGPGWTQREEFLDDVRSFAARPAWVTEWQYRPVRDLLADRAELLVWLDLPRSQVMRHVVARTVRRRLRRVELWNGNSEAPLWTVITDRDHIVRWAWSSHARVAHHVEALLVRRPDLPVVRLQSGRLHAAGDQPRSPAAAVAGQPALASS